jgi:hypothetical protein
VFVRRFAHAAATIVVAMLVALTVPVAQLTTVSIVETCCCPDPANCHCPHDKPDTSSCPTMRPCHRQMQIGVAPTLPGFQAPALVAIAPVVAMIELIHRDMPAPHASPVAKRPDAPS